MATASAELAALQPNLAVIEFVGTVLIVLLVAWLQRVAWRYLTRGLGDDRNRT